MSHPPNDGKASNRQAGHLDEDLCRDLLSGFLSNAEREEVLAHVATCPTCERLFAERVLEREHLRASRTFRVDPEGELAVEKHEVGVAPVRAEEGPLRVRESDDAPMPSPLWELWAKIRTAAHTVLQRPQHRYATGLVAVVTILLIIFWPRQMDRPDDLLLRWLPESTGDLQIRATTEAVDADLAAGFEAYANHDAQTAIALLRDAEATGRLEMLRKIYLGNALAWEGKYTDAAGILRTVRARILPDPWGSETRWTLYVALRESGDQAAADSLLRVLATERGEVGDRARAIPSK
jgi:hypothetical protein